MNDIKYLVASTDNKCYMLYGKEISYFTLFMRDSYNWEIESLDLFNIAEIKKKKGGDIELKFFDRLKALEKLQNISCESDSEDNSFYSAIEKGASALREYPLE